MSIRFTEIPSIDEQINNINENFEASDITELVGLDEAITLRPNQRTAIAALLDIEKHRRMEVDGLMVYTTAARIGEPFGSGKTMIVLGTISTCKMQTPGPFLKHKTITYYKRMNCVIIPNLIVVGASVFRQWERAITHYSKLRHLPVINGNDIISFYKLLMNGGINRYDIVLLKEGSTTVDVGAHVPTSWNISKGQSMYSIMFDVVSKSGKVWSRAFYDDYDVCGLDTSLHPSPALFSVFVSATSSKNNKRKEDTTFISCSRSKLLNTAFSIVSDAKYLEESLKMPKLTMIDYTIINKNVMYADVIGDMVDNKNITEMINSDSIATAARDAGIKARSVADIFHKLLDGEYYKLKRATRIREVLNVNQPLVGSVYDEPLAGGASNFNFRNLEQPMLRHLTLVAATAPEISSAYDCHHTELNKTVRDAERTLSNVKDNMADNACQICQLELNDPDLNLDVCILKCCNTIICNVCLVQGVKKTCDKGGRCGCCHKIINTAKDVIYISGRVDLSLVDVKNIDDNTEFEPVVEEPVTEEKEEDGVGEDAQAMEEQAPKLLTLRYILNGMVLKNVKDMSMTTRHCNDKAVLQGTGDCEYPADRLRKTLIFNNHDESIGLISKYLDAVGIKYVVLQGGASEIQNKIDAFAANDTRVMLINSRRHCAGLNFHHICSDIVFYHKIQDKSIESQVIGRMMRMGRLWNGVVHSLHYNNE